MILSIPVHDARHPAYCWCNWAWAGNQRWSPCARDGDSPDGPQDLDPEEVDFPHE